MLTTATSAPRRGHRIDLGVQKCRLCDCRLGGSADDDAQQALCGDCRGRPEARRLAPLTRDPDGVIVARTFQAADLSLIKRAGAYMQPNQLLAVLNERLTLDVGSHAMPHTMSQLQQALHEQIGNAAPAACSDWVGLRKVLAAARKDGLLRRVTPQLIEDFSVVYALSPAQALRLKEVLLADAEEDA